MADPLGDGTTDRGQIWLALRSLEDAGGGISKRAGWCVLSEIWHGSGLAWSAFRAGMEDLARRRRVQFDVVAEPSRGGGAEDTRRITHYVRSSVRAEQHRDLRGQPMDQP